MAGMVHTVPFTALSVDSWLPAPPPVVWPFISEPDRINQWSTARVHGLAAGDGGGFGAVGALRQVTLPRPLPPVTEVIQHADAPTRFTYRVVGSRAVRHHRGELRLSAEGDGTRLRWDVGMAFAIPGAAAVTRRALEPQLAASVKRLAAVVAGAPAPSDLPPAFIDDDDPSAGAAARATAQDQRELADRMQAGGDPRYWFSRVYQYVTEAMVEACARGEVAHATWALRLIPRFHELYIRSLDGTPEPHWQTAFDAIGAAAGAQASGPLPFWRALICGATAHIDGDLPRVLAATYTDHYAGRCDYDRFRADFLMLAPPLQRAWQRLSAEVPSRWFPPYLRVLDRLLPAEAVEHLTAKRFYDPLPARREAFEQGRALLAVPATTRTA
jgi:hypothetical protein